MSTILIILIILGILFILFLIFLAISFLLLCKGLDNREIEAHQLIEEEKHRYNTVSYDYNYFKEHLVEEEKKAIADLHNSIYYKLLSDEDKQKEDGELRKCLHIRREMIEGMIQGKHTLIDNPLNI